MKRGFFSLLLLMALCSGPAAFSGQPLVLKADSMAVEFKAVGRPSLLKINGKSARLEMKLERADGGGLKGSFEFPLDSLDTGIGLRDRHMKEKYLETGSFPVAKLEVTEALVPAEFFTREGAEQSLTVKGNLTLHGVTRPIDVQSRLVREGRGFSSESRFSLKLGDYGISIPKYAGITIAEDVELKIRFVAE